MRRRKGCGHQINGIKKLTKEELRKELQKYEKEGIRLLLDGHPSSPEEIARVCTLRESGSYMRDYIRDDKDVIREIGFDCVKDI